MNEFSWERNEKQEARKDSWWSVDSLVSLGFMAIVVIYFVLVII